MHATYPVQHTFVLCKKVCLIFILTYKTAIYLTTLLKLQIMMGQIKGKKFFRFFIWILKKTTRNLTLITINSFQIQ
jgi:hypothetical protein